MADGADQDNHFLFGQSINFLRSESPNDLYIQWMKRWPDAPVIRYLGFFNREVLVVNSLNSYKSLVQTNCYAMGKPGWWRGVTREIVGDGIIVMEGDEVWTASLPPRVIRMNNLTRQNSTGRIERCSRESSPPPA